MIVIKKIILGFIIVCNSALLFCQAGILDNSFNGNGLVVTSSGNGMNDNGRAVLVQDDGKIIVAGLSYPFIGMIRYNIDGSLDNTFGSGGIVLTPNGNDGIHALGASLQNDGKIIIGGYASGQAYYDFAVVRYNTDGSLDDSFGTDGIAIIDLGGTDIGMSIDLQSDGKIILGGYSDELFMFQFALIRIDTNGTLDESFGNDGVVKTYIEDSFNEINSVFIQSDGRIVAAGYSSYQGWDYPDFAILRYHPDGSLDQTLNSSGIVITDFNNDSYDIAKSVGVQADGKIVAAGYSKSNSDEDIALARYNIDGSLDLTFNQTGLITTDLGSFWDEGWAMVIQPDEKIVVAGFADSPTDVDYVLVRYNTDGSIDDSFGQNGIIWTDFGVGDDKSKAVCLDHEGRIIAAGYTGNLPSIEYSYSAARYINDLSIGIIDFDHKSILALVYPNPISVNTTLEYELKSDETISVSLYDCSGICVQHFIKDQFRAQGSYKEILNMSNSIPEGNYILVIDNGENLVSIKIYKQ